MGMLKKLTRTVITRENEEKKKTLKRREILPLRTLFPWPRRLHRGQFLFNVRKAVALSFVDKNDFHDDFHNQRKC